MDYKAKLQTNNVDLQEILESINDLPDASSGGGGIDTSDATATTSDILNGKTAYVDGNKITGTIPSQEAKTITPTKSAQTAISSGTYASGTVTVEAIPSQYIEITDATATASDILAGRVAYGANGKITGTIPMDSYKFITPTTLNQTAISAGTYANGTITIAGDANLIADNIKKGVSIFGVAGSYEGDSSGGIDTSDATATAADIVSGQTAYVNGEKITGTLVTQTYYVGDAEPSSSLGIDGDLYLVRAGE